VIGTAHGTAWVALTSFIGFITSRVADDLDVATSNVTRAVWIGSAISVALTITVIVRRSGVPGRRLTLIRYGATGVGALVVALAPSIVFVNVGMVLAPGAMLALTPIRPAVAARFSPSTWRNTRGGQPRLDGTFTGLSRAWSYATMAALGVLIPTIALIGPSAWRIAAAVFAAWVAVQTVILAKSDLLSQPPASERIEAVWDLWDVLKGGELRRGLWALGCSVLITTLVSVSIEPFLADPALLGRNAGVFAGLLGLVQLAIIPAVLRHGQRSDADVRHSSQLAASWLAISGVVALVTVLELPEPLLLSFIVIAVALMWMGAGPVNDATRTYASRDGIEADAMATLFQQAFYNLGALSGTLVHTSAVLRVAGGPWRLIVAAWVGVALCALYVTRRHEYRGEVLLRVGRTTKPGVSIAASRVGGRPDLLHIWLDVDGIPAHVRAPRGSLIVIHGPKRRRHPDSSRIALTTVRLGAGGWLWPRGKEEGRLWPWRRFPILDNGELVGIGRWHSWPGTWIVQGGRTFLHSDGLNRPKTIRVYIHNE
jgi:hypothetical protein